MNTTLWTYVRLGEETNFMKLCQQEENFWAKRVLTIVASTVYVRPSWAKVDWA